MKIKVADHSGFCFGVENAISKAKNEAKKLSKGRRIFSFGPLIHNKRVIEDLQALGIEVAQNTDEFISTDAVIVRSHGIGKYFYDLAAEVGFQLIDATCPFVSRIQDLVHKAWQEGKAVIIVGNKNHPEVKGINGWCDNTALVISDPQEALLALEEGLDRSLEYLLVAQTTMRLEIFNEIVDLLKDGGLDLDIKNTICSATKKRQEACAGLAKNSDVMIVVGDENSSNTRKLVEISEKYCRKTIFVENAEKLPLKRLSKYNRIGIAAGASTPEYAIKEVITRMSENSKDARLMEQYMDEIEKSLKMPRGGELVSGTVLAVRDDEIVVNLGRKKDGIIPESEVKLEEGQTLKDLFKVGDEIDAKVLKTDDGDGTILLSRRKLEVTVHWAELAEALENKETVTVKVARQVKGGVIAFYKEVQGFIPMSQLSDRYVEDASIFIGEELDVKVSRVDQRKSRAVFSHKERIMEEKQKLLDEIWETLNIGDIVQGKVMRFTDYGAFVDIGGIDGLLHISEISWSKLKHPKEVLSLGEEINVKILNMNREKGKISLGLKQTQPEPWSIVDEKFTVGEVVPGKVVQIKEYGCFVEISPGIDGLVHISEISNKRVGNIHEVLTVGQKLETKILDIDKENRRISLSIKEAMGDAFAPKTQEEKEREAKEMEAQAKAKTEEAKAEDEENQDSTPEPEVEADQAPEARQEEVEEIDSKDSKSDDASQAEADELENPAGEEADQVEGASDEEQSTDEEASATEEAEESKDESDKE